MDNTQQLFDLVVLLGPNDLDQINTNIEYNRKNIIGYRNFHVITHDANIKLPEEVILIDEKIFPFKITDVEYFHGKRSRNGWYLQQLIKIYAGIVIPEILEKYLVIDCDTFFLKPTTFIENDKCLYNPGTDYHLPYFEHMKKLNKNLYRLDESISGITHHTMFDTNLVKQLIKMVEEEYVDIPFDTVRGRFNRCNPNDKCFWKLYLIHAYHHCEGSGSAENELYFNYIFKFHSDKVKLRILKWENISTLSNIDSVNDYVSYHWYLR